MPSSWRGTTFNNSHLLGRRGFAERLLALVERKAASGEAITEAELDAVEQAEDYLRVASNVSTTLEIAVALEHDVAASQVFTFTSDRTAVIAVAHASNGKRVLVFLGERDAFFTEKELETLRSTGCNITLVRGDVAGHKARDDEVTLSFDWRAEADGVVQQKVLYILRADRIDEADL